MVGNQEMQLNIDSTSRYKIPRKFNISYKDFDSADPKLVYEALKKAADNWDYNRRWNCIHNLTLYREAFDKFQFITYTWILAVKEGLPLCCKTCGKLLKNPYGNKTHYCSKCIDSSKERREKISKTKLNKTDEEKQITLDKRIATTYKKYGVNNVSKSNKIREKISNAQKGISKPITKEVTLKANQKRYLTRKKHNSFKISKAEDFSIFILSQVIEIKSHYMSEEYPFTCDCYIPTMNLYIEFNYTWTHGRHPFNPDNPEDIQELNKLKEKSKELNFQNKPKAFYLNAIETWTIRDVKKRTMAKENNLNYLEFFTIEKYFEWLIRTFNLENTLMKLRLAYIDYMKTKTLNCKL